MRTVRFRRGLRPPWNEVPALALGAAAPAGAPADLCALVSRGSAPEYRLDLFAVAGQLHVYHQALFVGELLLLGFGHQVFVVRGPAAEARTVRLSSYFVSLHRAADAVYVATGEDVTRLDLRGCVVWTSPQLALDGVRVELITDAHVQGEAEQGRPGDWRPFRISTADGRPG